MRARISQFCALVMALEVSSDLVGQDPNYVFTALDVTATTLTRVEIAITLTNTGGAVQGFSFGLVADTPLIDPIDVFFGAALQSMNGGLGPDFFGNGFVPVPGGIMGFYCGTVFSFLGTETLGPGVHDVVHMIYDVEATAASSYEICFVDYVGSPPSVTAVIVVGASIIPVTDCATVEVEPPVFRRGDTNASGAIDIADPIYLLSYLFVGGPSVCLAATDANSDSALDLADALYLLLYINGMGPVPASPFPACAPASSPFSCVLSPACG
ncbi:MAG: hypothetical protein ACKVX7_07850 [Planctomycetota bacterium]